jgi:hypothetical protein
MLANARPPVIEPRPSYQNSLLQQALAAEALHRRGGSTAPPAIKTRPQVDKYVPPTTQPRPPLVEPRPSILGGQQRIARLAEAQREGMLIPVVKRLIKAGKVDAAEELLGQPLSAEEKAKLLSDQNGAAIGKAMADNLIRLDKQLNFFSKQEPKHEALAEALEEEEKYPDNYGDLGEPDPDAPAPYANWQWDDELGYVPPGGLPLLENDDHFPVIHGSGVLGRKASKFIQFGQLEFDKSKLEKDILAVRFKHNKHKLTKVPNMSIRSGFRNVLSTIIAGQVPSTTGLSANEQSVLDIIQKTSRAPIRNGARTVHGAGARADSELMSSARSAAQVLRNRLAVTAGEIQSGNDNHQVRNQFASLLRSAYEQGIIDPAQAKKMSRLVANV